jgi:hypothetical protein
MQKLNIDKCQFTFWKGLSLYESNKRDFLPVIYCGAGISELVAPNVLTFQTTVTCLSFHTDRGLENCFRSSFGRYIFF